MKFKPLGVVKPRYIKKAPMHWYRRVSFRERLQILFGRPLSIDLVIWCENDMGRYAPKLEITTVRKKDIPKNIIVNEFPDRMG